MLIRLRDKNGVTRVVKSFTVDDGLDVSTDWDVCHVEVDAERVVEEHVTMERLRELRDCFQADPKYYTGWVRDVVYALNELIARRER